MVGTEAGTNKKGQISKLTHLMRAHLLMIMQKIQVQQRNKFLTTVNSFNPYFILPQSKLDFEKAKEALDDT